MVKRALVAPLITAAATLPAVAAHSPAATAAVASPAAASQPAAAARPHHPRHPRRYWAYQWAKKQRGKPYCWGGTSGCFDCSGLVMAAYRHVHLNFGRATGDMLASGRLARVSVRHLRQGDLAFFGTGHVELVTSRHFTFGALHTGAPVGWHRSTQWWHPTMYFHVMGSH